MNGHPVADLQLKVTVVTTDVTAMVLKLQDRLSPSALKGFLIERAHRDLRLRAEQRFSSEGDDATGPWQQLAYATGRIRMFQGYGPFHPINVRTGKLKSFVLNSFTIKAQSRGVTLMMPGSATGELMAKFRTAQQGGGGKARTSRPTTGEGSSGPNRMAPARPVLALMSRDREMIYNDLLDWVRAGIF